MHARLAVVCGTGIQLLLMTALTIGFAMLGMLSPGAVTVLCAAAITLAASRGALATMAIVSFMLMGAVGGFYGARLYRFALHHHITILASSIRDHRVVTIASHVPPARWAASTGRGTAGTRRCSSPALCAWLALCSTSSCGGRSPPAPSRSPRCSLSSHCNDVMWVVCRCWHWLCCGWVWRCRW